MRRVMALAFVVCAMVLLGGAGGVRVGVGGGGLNPMIGASYQAGGAPAGWDTVVTLFSPEARAAIPIDNTLDVAGFPKNPAGIDTFALPASASAADIARIVKLNSQVLGRDGTIYSFRDGPSDSARVLRLGTGFDVPTFAYGQLDSTVSAGYKDAIGISVSMISDARWLQDPDGTGPRGTSSYLETRFATLTRRAELVHIPVQDHLPDRPTIVSAIFNVAVAPGWYLDYPDSIITTLMSNASDNKWYTQKGQGSFSDWAETSWERQNTSAWGGSNAFPWVPAMSDRKYLWQFGNISDWTGGTDTDLPTPLTASSGLDIEATNCVQAAVNGTTNNGFLLMWAEQAAPVGTGTHYLWDDVSTAIGRTPYLAVKYITKKYQPPFGTSDFAFIFASDDGVFPANTVWSDTVEALGGNFTMFMAQTQVIIGNSGAADYSTDDQLVNFRTVRGREVANHSLLHKLLGLSHYERKDAPFSTEDWDSLLLDSSPEWLYAMADTIVGDLRGDPYFAKSIALPNNQSSPTVMNAIDYHDYVTVRSGAAQNFDRNKYFEYATFAKARADSVQAGATRRAERWARNMVGLPFTIALEGVTGVKGNAHTTTAELDSVKNNTRKLLFQLRGDGRRTLMVFTHDLKTDPSFPPPGYADGLDGNEIGSIGRVVNELGGRWMTASEYGRWIQGTATPVATPVGFAQPDSFRFDAADRVWFKPNGVDNRWIRGVR